MTRDEIRLKAEQADRLMRDDAFKAFVEEIRGDCIAAFVNSGPEDTGTREEAHGLLRAITKLQSKLSAAVAAEAIAAKREK